ncbi:MAG: prepilin-type N-terminal cleavage/methylation domain-containing protein [Nautiliaceae bacterium]|jgi:prepilin-type N-terminal cleavage/methylation domain-containing protein
MKKAFTLIELIFVIVIIGLLAAVAIPKFQNLRQNAIVTGALQPLTDLNSSGGASSFLNQAELNGVNLEDINMTNLYKFTGKEWTADTTNKQVTYRSGQYDFNATFTYDANHSTGEANVTVKYYCDTKSRSGKAFENALKAKGYDCSATGKTYIIDLTTQD